MFKVERVATFEYSCPAGHPIRTSYPGQHLRFCPKCGQDLIEQCINFDAPYCTNCRNQVDPDWNYCAYCGESKEGDDED